MHDRIKLPLIFDVQRLHADLDCLRTYQWLDHFVTRNYEGEWSVIILRGPATATHPVTMMYSDPMCTEFADMPILKSTHYFSEVLQTFCCPIEAVRLMKLSAGSRIKEHRDFDLDVECGSARLHIPIRTNDGVDFRLNGTRVILQEGECWYLRLSDPHSVYNQGSTDRVHLVIDVRTNEWLRTLLLN